MQYTFFFHLTSPFSNFHPSKFIYKDITFISNEQFMMYCKAKQFQDELSAERIISLNKTSIAENFINGTLTRESIITNKADADKWNKLMLDIKKIGRGVKNYDDAIWQQKREKIVYFGAKLKFTQNEDLKQIFLNTGDTLMVEASRFDPVWSCGLTEYDAKRTPKEQWPGLNLLGNVLDHLKVELQKNLQNQHNNLTQSVAIDVKRTISSEIEVVNFYQVGKIIPEDGAYMGRYNANFNLPASIFANPYPVYKPEDRGLSLGKYNTWLWQQIADNKITKSDLLALQGKKLVCYCSPKPCHSNIVKEAVELLINNEIEFDNIVKEHKKTKKPGLN